MTRREIAFWLVLLAAYFALPGYRVLGSQILIMALFCLSLDLILGYAGIVSLGHAAFFGVGAYTAGLLAKHYWTEPLTGLVLAAIIAGLAGYALSHVVVRFRHLALIMLTMGFGLLLHEAANSASMLTGGADGLQGFKVPAVLGFKFDMFGRTAYAYSLGLMVVVAGALWLFFKRSGWL